MPRSYNALIIIIFVISTALSLLGCQNGSGSSPSAPPNPAPWPNTPINRETPRSLSELNLPELACVNPKGCPGAVGELVTLNSMGVPSFCTATLVSGDVVLTAAHCIPWDQIGKDGQFKGGCWVRWPKDSANQTPAAIPCRHLLDGRRINGPPGGRVKLDHAFIRLTSSASGRRPVPLIDDDAHAHRDHSSVVIFGTLPDPRRHEIKALACQRQDDFQVAEISALPGETIVLPSCGIHPGYSGGPILDPSTRSIIGVVSFMKREDPSRPGVPGPAVGTDVPSMPGQSRSK